ncbi:Galactokinase [Zancudomyces culisetae]|uniref:Galactokinase n=1 Tax=Zancudomyces culisetae TaxID=1213189 RepID=A0A1R1PSP0_ZANCU|nr:Galactokinase [Zancudomyces culisetae]|eukprot:OMH83978.1 Galactokinase [Zancudomyces culisetae]
MGSIPIVSAVSQIYGCDNEINEKRYQEFMNKFKSLYNQDPEFIVRAPGRVNIIGEHIDYCGMPVLPMAIEPDILVAVTRRNDNTIQVNNENSGAYKPFTFTHTQGETVEIDTSNHFWGNYFKCGYRGAYEATNEPAVRGMNCLLGGNLPTGSGLSSSSALVCCSAMTFSLVNDTKLTQSEIVECAVKAERYVGVNGGGMDQTCSIMAKNSSALFIEFHPKTAVTDVKFPKTDPQIAFVIANTLVTSNKKDTAPVCYNLRVVETRIAALMLAKHLQIQDFMNIANPLTMKIVMDMHLNEDAEIKQCGETEVWCRKLGKMVDISKAFFGKNQGGFTWEQCAEYLGMTVEELKIKVQTDRFPVIAESLQLYNRTLHVYSEALRVVKFRQICENGGDNNGPTIQRLGELMNESQESCDGLFNCSCEELNTLCGIARYVVNDC